MSEVHSSLTPSQASRLADRSSRLFAQLCDGLITGVPVAATTYGCGLLVHRFVPNLAGHAPLTRMLYGLVVLGVYIGFYLGINGWLLVRNGQTLGKKICGIRIARPDGSVPSLSESFVRRELVFAAPISIFQIFIPGLNFTVRLVDVLFIFRSSRKCLHDNIAGTIVVKV
ncbi:MAG TPA: RDD family protein [Holophagaceae bacterium]|jgi:uncharacterized RDD family membrane protein YckC|nr:RDD family protein [Holophagaceae bacterium]